jgi:ADP-ribose pyrophosphatase YjhB (NUDIX family)
MKAHMKDAGWRSMKPVKHSIAVLIRNPANPQQILTVRRSHEDEEHPGTWGLPAGSFRHGESPTDLIRRIGQDKLQVSLAPGGILRSGDQERESYILQMELWDAQVASGVPQPRTGSLPGVSYYVRVQWALPEILRAGQSKGSLCCRLGLEVFGGE